MNTGGIDAQRITSMLAQLKATAQGEKSASSPSIERPSGLTSIKPSTPLAATSQVSFSDALKASLEQVNQMQVNAENLGKDFVMGNDNVSLSDVMIAGQKANISFQATVQVRNKLVNAYQEMMNMQV